MSEAVWLIDKSALSRLGAVADRDEWFGRINRGLVRITMATLLEVGFSARSGDDWNTVMTLPPISAMPVASMTPTAERRALDVQGQLARRGLHRAPSVPDLLVAAVAESAGLTLLHLDKDFDLIADVTGQVVERLSLA